MDEIRMLELKLEIAKLISKPNARFERDDGFYVNELFNLWTTTNTKDSE